MPAKDDYHDLVKDLLEKDQWTITHENFRIPFGGKKIFIDIGAEKLIIATKDKYKIAVEVKSFLGSSPLTELESAIGQ